MAPDLLRMRVDKWLWAARFFKTRSLASEAVEGGKVQVNGARIKPSRELKVDDRVSVHIGEQNWEVTVSALSDRRGPAPVAQALYAEEPASREARLRQQAERHLRASPGGDIKGRPTKKDRRLIRRFTDAT